jgi:hypothetical protein
MRCAGTQHGRAETNPIGQPPDDRNSGEKLNCQQKMTEELA